LAKPPVAGAKPAPAAEAPTMGAEGKTVGANADRFYIRTPEGFQEVKGKAVTIPGAESLDTFIQKSPDGKTFNVTEGRSGMSMGTGTTQAAAIELATVTVKKLGLPAVEAFVEQHTARQGISPRWEGRYTPAEKISPGDKVFRVVPGIGGIPRKVEGTVYRTKNGWRVKIDPGQPVGGAKTQPLTVDWRKPEAAKPPAAPEGEGHAAQLSRAELKAFGLEGAAADRKANPEAWYQAVLAVKRALGVAGKPVPRELEQELTDARAKRNQASGARPRPDADLAGMTLERAGIGAQDRAGALREIAGAGGHEAQLSVEETSKWMRGNGIRAGTPAERAEGRLDGPLDWLGQVWNGVRNLSRYAFGSQVQLEFAQVGKRGSPAAGKGLEQMTGAEAENARIYAQIAHKAIELGRNLPKGARHLQIVDPKFEDHPKFLKLSPAQQAKVREAAAEWRRWWREEIVPQAVASGLKVRVERGGKVTYEPLSDHLIDSYWRHVWSKELIQQIGAGRGELFQKSLDAIVANHDAPDIGAAKLILASGYLSRRAKLPQWASDILRQTGAELPPPPDTPMMPTYEDLTARFGQKGLPREDANRITWAALNERSLDLPAEAYEYGWEKTGNELARNMARTIAGANAYGQAFEKLGPVLNDLRLQKGDAAARALYESVRAQIQPKQAGPVAKTLRGMAAPITALATTSIRSFWLKNILAGEYKLGATVSVGSYVGGLVDTVKALGIRIADRVLRRVPNWTLAETSGAIEAALPQNMGLLSKLVNAVPFYRGAEIPLREHSVNAWMREIVKLVPRFLKNPTQKRGMSADAKWQLKSRLKLSDTDIHDLAAALGGTPKLGVKAQVENLKTALPSLMKKMAYWAAESTQSIANPRTLPQWATRPELAPFTIFQRMGFAGWTNDIKNVAIPLSKGNPLPLIKYIGGAVLAGEAFAAMLHLALGRREPAEDQPTVTRILDNMAQIEIAQPFAFLMSPLQRTQTAEGIPIPTVFRAFFLDSYANLFNSSVRLLTGKETAGQTVEDLSRSMVGLYRDGIAAWEAAGKEPKFQSTQARTRLRNAWVFSGNKPPVQGRPIAADYPYVRQIRAAFWTDDPEAWKQSVQSATEFWKVSIAQDAEEAGKPMSPGQVMQEVRRQALQHLDAEAPVPGGMPLADVQRALVQMGPDGRAQMAEAFRAYDDRRRRFLQATGLPPKPAGGQRRQAILRGPQAARAVPPSYQTPIPAMP